MISESEFHCFFFPFNGNALEALSCLPTNFSFLGFIDDNPKLENSNFQGYTIFSRNILKKFPDAKVLAVPGNPHNFKSRGNIIDGLNLKPHQAMNAIHHSAVVSAFASIGENVLIMPGVVIMPNVSIGNHVCVLPNSVIHHGSVINDYNLIGANVTIAGNVQLGPGSYIGSGSSIKNDLRIGPRTLVGMGSVVLKNFEGDMVIAGCPAKSIKR
jgi:sugar O-acyltransferase (sialic acid O-acetyltransferase NeuD family)